MICHLVDTISPEGVWLEEVVGRLQEPPVVEAPDRAREVTDEGASAGARPAPGKLLGAAIDLHRVLGCILGRTFSYNEHNSHKSTGML